VEVEDEDFDPFADEEEEHESPAPAEDDEPIPSGDPDTIIRGLTKQLQNKDAVIRRLKTRESKKIEQTSVQAAEEAVELYKQTQARLSRTKKLFESAGYPGLAQDFLAFNDDAEPTPDAVQVYLQSRGLRSSEEEQPVRTGPPAAASFHEGSGGTSAGAGPMTWEEYSEKARSDPAGAKVEAERRRLEKLGGLGEL
jgi:hypothetical protein